MNQDHWIVAVLFYVLAVSLGIGIGMADAVAPFGDDMAKVTLLLLVLSGGLLGLIQPRSPWRWALAMGPWLAVVHLVVQFFGREKANLSSLGTLILIPVALVACTVGAYLGAVVRCITLPDEPLPL